MGKPQLKRVEDLAALGQEVREEGFQALKTNIFLFDGEPRLHFPGFAGSPGWPSLNAERSVINALRAQLEALRAGAGADIGILLDLNFNFKTEGYLQVAPRPRRPRPLLVRDRHLRSRLAAPHS